MHNYNNKGTIQYVHYIQKGQICKHNIQEIESVGVVKGLRSSLTR